MPMDTDDPSMRRRAADSLLEQTVLRLVDNVEELKEKNAANNVRLESIESALSKINTFMEHHDELMHNIDGAVKFMKILSTIAAAGAALWAWLATNVSSLFGGGKP